MRIIRKGISLILLEIVIAFLFTSCSSGDKQDKRAHFEPYIISTEADAGELQDAAVYEETAYLVSKDKIVTYDLVSGERAVVAEASGNTTVCADKEYIYTYNKDQNAVIKYDKKGKVKETYPCSFDPIEADIMSVFNDTVVISSKFSNPVIWSSKLYKLDLSTGENSMVSGYKGKDTYSWILSLDFIDNNTIMITSLANPSMVDPIAKYYKYDLQKDKQLDSSIISYDTSYSYDAVKKCFYNADSVTLEAIDYSMNIEELRKYKPKTGMNIQEFYPESSTNVTSGSINDETLNSLRNNKDSFVIDKTFHSDDTVTFWSAYNNCFLIIDLRTDKEPLNVILTSNSIFKQSIPLIIDQFNAEYDYPVHVTEYAEETFAEKLRTKLLAGDSDYDIFFVENPAKDNLLSSILTHDLYEPLDNYDGIVSNFNQMYKGIRSMMSYNGKLFGVPYAFNNLRRSNIEYDLSQYAYTIPDKHLTNNDVWQLCDEIINSGDKNVSVLGIPQLIRFLFNFTQEAINNQNLDKTALTELLNNIKKYNDAGVLFDPDFTWQDPGTKNHLFINSGYLMPVYIGDDMPEYPQYGTVSDPAYSKTIYYGLSGCAFINKSSKNKEMAAKLLEVMTKSENIYNTGIYQWAFLGSDLTKYDKYKGWSANELSYLSDLPSLYENAGIITNDFSSLSKFIGEKVEPGFFDGSLSPEETAEMLYEQINYTYFE